MQVTGNVGKDAVLKTIGNDGKQVLEFSIAEWSGKKDTNGNAITTWINCKQWYNTGQQVSDYMHPRKGDLITVMGDPEIRTYTTNDGEARAILDVTVRYLKVLSKSKNPDSGSPAPQSTYVSDSRPEVAGFHNQNPGGTLSGKHPLLEDEDIPF